MRLFKRQNRFELASTAPLVPLESTTLGADAMNPIERKIVTQLVANGLAAGFSISVFDGEGYSLRKCTDAKKIIKELGHTDENMLRFWDGTNSVGSVELIFGNGEDVISDATNNRQMIALIENL